MNQADRQIFNAVLPSIKADLGLTDSQSGLIATIFILTMAVMLPVAGFLGDRFSRNKIVLISIFAWSIATLLTGFTTGLISFIIIRSLATAVGEAFYVPAATALIGQHHVRSRSQALAIHQSALYFGTVLGGWGAGWLADQYGWKHSFWVFGGLGVILVILMARRLKGAAMERQAVAAKGEPVGAVLRSLFRTPTALVLAGVLGCATFVNMGYLTWMPTYLHEHFSLSLAKAGFNSMFWHQIFAFAGVLLGGYFSDRLARGRPRVRLEISGLAILAAGPALYFMGTSGQLWTVYAALGCFGLCRGLYDSNIYASLFDIVPPRYHASATGLMVAFSFAVGSLAPIALGVVKQMSNTLSWGIASLGLVYVAGSLALLFAARWLFPADFLRNQQDVSTTQTQPSQS
jgi:MFS family permease